MLDQLPDIEQFFRALSPEQVIEVSKILPFDVPMRTVLRAPQLAEQLEELPTIISYSSLQRTVEQNVDIPVPRGGGPISGLQGFSSGQSSTASQLSLECISERIAEQIVDIPVSGGGLQDFRPGQSSTAFPGAEGRCSLHHGDSQRSAAQNVDIPVPDGRGTSCYGGLQVSPPGQSSRARRGAHVRGRGVQGSVPGQSSPALGRADVRGRGSPSRLAPEAAASSRPARVTSSESLSGVSTTFPQARPWWVVTSLGIWQSLVRCLRVLRLDSGHSTRVRLGGFCIFFSMCVVAEKWYLVVSFVRRCVSLRVPDVKFTVSWLLLPHHFLRVGL